VSRQPRQGLPGQVPSNGAPNDPSRGTALRANFLLSPIFLASLGLLLLNDFVLKPFFPGPVSGILSDLAGMVFFPVLLVGLAELLAWLLPGRPLARPSWFAWGTVFVVAAFLLVKYTTFGHEFYVDAIQPIGGLIEPLGLGTTGASSDPWDLLALLLMPVPIWLGYRYRTGQPSTPGAR